MSMLDIGGHYAAYPLGQAGSAVGHIFFEISVGFQKIKASPLLARQLLSPGIEL